MAEEARTSPPLIHIQMQFYAQSNPTPSFAFSFHIFGASLSYISRQFSQALSALRYYLSCFIQIQFVTAFNQSIALIVPIFTNLLQLKSQQGTNDQNISPFATHPTTMILAVTSSLVYFFATITLLQFPLCRSAVVARHCFLPSGYAMVATLASLLLPNSISPFVYALFALRSSIEWVNWLCHRHVVEEDGAELQAYGRRFHQFFNTIFGAEEFQAYGRRFRRGNSSGHNPQRLPV